VPTRKPAELTDAQVLELLARETAARKAAEEALIRKARENLAKYGTTIAPMDLPAVGEAPPSLAGQIGRELATRGTRRPRDASPQFFGMKKKCPHCGKTKDVGKEFGTVIRNGLEHAASWCKQCRSGTNYRQNPSPKSKKSKK